MPEGYRAANGSVQQLRCRSRAVSCFPVLPYLGIELEPVLHVILQIRVSSSSGSGSGQFIRSRRTLASHREKEESQER